MATKNQSMAGPTDDEVQHAMSILQDDSFTGDAINPALESLYAELGMSDAGEATVHVTILNVDGTGKEANIWRGNPEDYDLEGLAKQFGSGEYRVKIYVRVPQGSKVLKANKVFYWKLTPEQEKKRLNPEAEKPVFNPMDLARLITEGIKAAMPQQPAAPQIDPFDQMQKFASIMQMMQRPEPQYVQQQPVNQLGALRDMAELIQTLRGDSDEPAGRGANSNDLLMTLISKFAPVIGSVLTQQVGNPSEIPGAMPAPQLQSQPAQPYPTIPQVEQHAQQQQAHQPNETGEDVSLKLKMGLGWLIGQCDGGGAPETYAEVILDSVPEEAITQMVNAPDPLSYLAQFDPRVNTEPYKTWFTNLIAAIKEYTAPENQAKAGGNHVQ